jgi:hypothetical protein
MSSKSKILFTVIFLFALSLVAQTPASAFEGEIVYSNKYKSKNPKMKEQTITAMMGIVHNYFIKGGDYKTMINGQFAEWQLYISKENRIYSKMKSSDLVMWNDGSEYDDEVLNAEVNKNVIKILEYDCDELILTCRSGVHKYYYNSQLTVDPKLFLNHKYGNYYNYISRTKAVPLKMIIEDSEIIIESTATEVKPQTLDGKIFTLPPNVKVEKNTNE